MGKDAVVFRYSPHSGQPTDIAYLDQTRLAQRHVGHHQLRVPRMIDHPKPAATLDELSARTRYLLIDSDGAICDIYAGLPASTIADRLRKLITGQGITPSE
jgi:hypothetical protein